MVRLVEQYDVPELQVLIEIFIITVSRDFSRQIDSILSASPVAGGNNNQEVRLTQVARAAAMPSPPPAAVSRLTWRRRMTSWDCF